MLPDRVAKAVAAPEPAAPAVVELARELVDSPTVGVVGGIRSGGMFAARVWLTDAGRDKLRAALAKRAGRP